MFEKAILKSKIKGAVVIPNDFSSKLSKRQKADLLVITYFAEVNTANYVQSYAMSIAKSMAATSKYRRLMPRTLIGTERSHVV